MCVRTWVWCAFYILCVCNVHLYTLQLFLAISITFFLTQFSFLFTIQKFSSCFFFALSLSRFYFFYRFVFKCIFILWSPSLFVCVCASANAHFTVSVFEYSFTYLRLHYIRIRIRIQYIIWCRKWYIIKCQLFCCRWWCSCCHHRWPFLRLLFCCNFWILFCMSVCVCECLYKMSTKYDTCLFMSHSACSHFEHREKPAAPFLRVPCDHIHLDVYLFNDYSMLHK